MMAETTKSRTTVSLTNTGRVLFERETSFFAEPNDPDGDARNWTLVDRVKTTNLDTAPQLGWVKEFTSHIWPSAEEVNLAVLALS